MDFTPLRISTIKPGKEITFDLYIFFKEQFLKYLDNGKALNEDLLGKLKKQKVARFYITDKDESNYQKFLDAILAEAVASADMPTEEKVNIVEGAASTAVERMQKDPGNKSAYNMTENAARSLRQVVSKNPDALKQIYGKEAEKGDMIIKHSLNVSALSTKLGEKMGLSDEVLDDLATAALIHDIGIISLGDEMVECFFKPLSELPNETKIKYRTHPNVSAEVLASKPYVNKRISDLIMNHEEVISGKGPNKKNSLTPEEEILSLVNSYDKRMIEKGLTSKEAIKEVTIDEVGNYDLGLINKFKEVLKTEGLI
ncbi:MAG: HD domain-containing protein [Halobacteriovoraceae bacterium]|nr:HD domain-containing protein [Halobacteriovoraceae bacterium]